MKQDYTHRRDKGISIIELMITLVIASILTLAVVQIYLDNRRTQLLQQSQVHALDNSRFNTIILDSLLYNAGYRRAPDDPYTTSFPATPAAGDCSAFAAGAAITTLSSANTVGFCLRYQPAFSGQLDCQGNEINLAAADDIAFKALDTSQLIVNAIRFIPGNNNRLENGVIQCSNTSSNNAAFVDIVNGVADFRVHFGVHTSNNALDRTIDKIVAFNDWNHSVDGNILAVRYETLLASLPGQRDGDSSPFERWKAENSETQNERLNNQDNNHIYLISSNSHTIRNLTP